MFCLIKPTIYNKHPSTHIHTHPLSLAQPLESAIYTSLSSIFQLSHGLVVYTEFGKWGQAGERDIRDCYCVSLMINAAWQTCSRWKGEEIGRVSEKGAISDVSVMVPFQSHLSACTGWVEHSPWREREMRERRRKWVLFKWNHMRYFSSYILTYIHPSFWHFQFEHKFKNAVFFTSIFPKVSFNSNIFSLVVSMSVLVYV